MTESCKGRRSYLQTRWSQLWRRCFLLVVEQSGFDCSGFDPDIRGLSEDAQICRNLGLVSIFANPVVAQMRMAQKHLLPNLHLSCSQYLQTAMIVAVQPVDVEM